MVKNSLIQSEKTISKDQVVTQYDLTCGRTYENITNEDGTKVVVGWRVNSPTGELLDNKMSYTFDSNTKLYAVWQNVVNVTFEYDDFVVGKFANSELPVDYIQNMLEKPYEYCPFGEGEVFVGWYNKDTNEKLTKNTKITKDCTYVARVSKSNPKVTIDYNDGNGLLKDIELIGGYTNLYYLTKNNLFKCKAINTLSNPEYILSKYKTNNYDIVLQKLRKDSLTNKIVA